MARVLVTHSETHPVDVELITELLDEHEVRTLEIPYRGLEHDLQEEFIEALEGCEALLLRPGVVSRRVIEESPSLRVIAIHGSGYERVDLEAATEHGVVVANNPGSSGPGVVEHTFGLLFTLIRELPEIFERTAAGEWVEARYHTRELNHTTLGVVGLGRIGFRVASIASQAFDAEVLGYDPYVSGERRSSIYPRFDRETVEDAGIELCSLEALLDRSDVVTLHVPRTEETMGMIGAGELERLEGKFLINTCRGGVIDEPALIDAVERDTFAGVALDVMEKEPPSPDNPLLGADGVLVTPHVAGISDAYLERAAQMATDVIRTVLEGGTPETVVNPAVLADE